MRIIKIGVKLYKILIQLLHKGIFKAKKNKSYQKLKPNFILEKKI